MAQLSVDPPRDGPCAPWADFNDAVAYGLIPHPPTIDPDLFELCATVASEILFRKTAMQYPGQCDQTIRPYAMHCLAAQPLAWWDQYGYPYMPELISGVWWNFSPCHDPCQPYAGQPVELGAWPVTDILSVKIDGAEVDPAVYRLDRWHELVRVDGNRWPDRQNLLAADSQAGTFSIRFRYGTRPPAMAVLAAAELATEMAKHADPKANTSLPLRVTSVSRQGVSYSLPDVMAVIDKGGTGLYFVDTLLRTVNPDQLRAPARILSPDVHGGPQRVGSQ